MYMLCESVTFIKINIFSGSNNQYTKEQTVVGASGSSGNDRVQPEYLQEGLAQEGPNLHQGYRPSFPTGPSSDTSPRYSHSGWCRDEQLSTSDESYSTAATGSPHAHKFGLGLRTTWILQERPRSSTRHFQRVPLDMTEQGRLPNESQHQRFQGRESDGRHLSSEGKSQHDLLAAHSISEATSVWGNPPVPQADMNQPLSACSPDQPFGIHIESVYSLHRDLTDFTKEDQLWPELNADTHTGLADLQMAETRPSYTCFPEAPVSPENEECHPQPPSPAQHPQPLVDYQDRASPKQSSTTSRRGTGKPERKSSPEHKTDTEGKDKHLVEPAVTTKNTTKPQRSKCTLKRLLMTSPKSCTDNTNEKEPCHVGSKKRPRKTFYNPDCPADDVPEAPMKKLCTSNSSVADDWNDCGTKLEPKSSLKMQLCALFGFDDVAKTEEGKTLPGQPEQESLNSQKQGANWGPVEVAHSLFTDGSTAKGSGVGGTSRGSDSVDVSGLTPKALPMNNDRTSRRELQQKTRTGVKEVYIGDHQYSRSGLTTLDGEKIYIGDHQYARSGLATTEGEKVSSGDHQCSKLVLASKDNVGNQPETVVEESQ